MRPFLKWPGNKFKSRQQIIKLLPKGKRLIEPFAGSGAIFLNTSYQEYWLNDKNSDLINLYQQLQEAPSTFISYCRSFLDQSIITLSSITISATSLILLAILSLKLLYSSILIAMLIMGYVAIIAKKFLMSHSEVTQNLISP